MADCPDNHEAIGSIAAACGESFARCSYCGLPVGVPCHPTPANDTLDALVELRAAEIAALAEDPEWQVSMGMTMHEDRGWYDRESWATHTVWPSDEAGWLAHAIVHHDEEQR